MANTINTVKDGPGLFAKGVAERLRDNLKFCSFVDKADESEFDGKNGFKSGDTIYTSIPARKIVQEDNLDISSLNKDSKEEKAALTLDKTATTADEFDSLELATDVDVKNALKRFGMPAADALAHQIEARCFQIATDKTYNLSGTAGSTQFTVSDILESKTLLDENLAPLNDRMLFMNSRNGAEAVDARKGLFQSSEEIAKQYRDGYIGRADGFDWVQTQLVGSLTTGSQGGTPLTDGTGSEGDAIIHIDGVTSGNTWTKGTVFTVEDIYMVHPITKETTGQLQKFVVTADTTFTSGEADVPISPSLYAAATDGRKNVDALPTDGKTITLLSGATASTTYNQSLALHKSAFKMVTVPLYQPKGVDLVASETVDGITVNIVRDYDQTYRKITTRYDVLYGFDAVRPEWSTRITA